MNHYHTTTSGNIQRINIKMITEFHNSNVRGTERNAKADIIRTVITTTIEKTKN